MSIDYDAPRAVQTDEPTKDSLQELTGRIQPDVIDTDDDSVEPFELPEGDLSGEELSVRVIPKKADEFICSKCFLVYHRGRLASLADGQPICTECAS